MSECAECGRDHCAACSKLYERVGYLVQIKQYWEANNGISHIIAKDPSDAEPFKSGRVLCSGDLLVYAEKAGVVPVQYGMSAQNVKVVA